MKKKKTNTRDTYWKWISLSHLHPKHVTSYTVVIYVALCQTSSWMTDQPVWFKKKKKGIELQSSGMLYSSFKIVSRSHLWMIASRGIQTGCDVAETTHFFFVRFNSQAHNLILSHYWIRFTCFNALCYPSVWVFPVPLRSPLQNTQSALTGHLTHVWASTTHLVYCKYRRKCKT